MRYLKPAIGIMFFLALALMFWGCQPSPAIKTSASPVPLAGEIAKADAAGVAIDRAAQTVQTEAQAVRATPALPAAAVPHVDAVTAAAGTIRQEAARLDAATDAAASKDSGNAVAIRRLETVVTSLTDENDSLREENHRLADTVFRRVIVGAFGLGILALATSGVVGYWLRDLKAAALLAFGGIGAILAAVTANRLMAWDRWLAGGIVAAVVIVGGYGVFLVISNLRRKFAQSVETAQAFAEIQPGNTAAFKYAATKIQDPGTVALVDKVKAELGLKSIATVVKPSI